MFKPGECEICRRKREVAVVASPFGPLSHAICTECLGKPAESRATFDYLYDDVAGGDPTKLDKSIHNWYTWIDGRYVHWHNYVLRRQREKEDEASS